MNEVVKLNKNQKFLNQALSTGLEISSGANSDFIKALKNDHHISTLNLPLTMFNGEVTGEGNKDFQFASKGNLIIKGGADAGIRLGFYDDNKSLLRELKHKENLNLNLEDDTEDNQVYALLAFDYQIKGSAKVKWVLGSGGFTFGGAGEAVKRLLIIRKLDKNTPVKRAIKETLGELKAPDEISKPEDLKESTYLIVETESKISGSLGVQFGYDFNWVRQTKLGNLEGEVGLKAKLGAQLDVGFDIAGRYALAISRPTQTNLRIKLFKQKKKGWSFALSLGAQVKGQFSDSFTEKNLDEFLKATIGLHHAQILDSLKKLNEITDPAKLEEKLNGLSEQLLRKLFSGAHAETFEEVRTKALGFLDKWEKLHEKSADISATLWKVLDEGTPGDLKKIKEFIDQLTQADNKTVKDLIEKHLSNVGFERTILGQMIESLLPVDDLLEVLNTSKTINQLKSNAKALSKVLETEVLLENLHHNISEELGIKKILKILSAADLENVEPWLKGKLAEAVNKKVQNLSNTALFKEIQEIKSFINNIYAKREELFEKTKRALQKEYNFSLGLNYQKQLERSALIDVEFSYKPENPGLERKLQNVLRGNYNEVLTKQISGVKLHLGVLTHSVKRQKEIEISLPFIERNFKRINQAVVKASFVDEDDGRLMVYDLEAEDIIQRRNKRMSRLALVGSLGFGGKLPDTMTLSYSFKQAKRRLKTRELEGLLLPFVNKYLNRSFETAGKAPISEWIDDLDGIIDKTESNGTHNFGRTLLNLEVRVPVTAATIWLDAPINPSHAAYQNISAVIQESLKQLIPFYFFQDPQVFKSKSQVADAVLVYQSMPPKNDFKFDKKGRLKSHWQFTNSSVRTKVYNLEDTKLNLARAIGYAFAILEHSDDKELQKIGLEKYSTKDNRSFKRIAKNPKKDPFIVKFLRAEREIIKSTILAGTKLGQFSRQAQGNPQAAIVALNEFGSAITNSFNALSLGNIARRKDYTRYLGPMVFVEIVKALGQETVNTQASLELIALKEDGEFELESYLQGALPKMEDIVIAERVFDLD